jgi:amidophosphoribosyltransferase
MFDNHTKIINDQVLDDHPHEECGVFGIYAPGRDVARLSFFALYALQHRGQEAAGIATSDGQRAYLHKEMGLVNQVFNEQNLQPLKGHLAIGHTRYSTTGSSFRVNAQPYLVETIYGPLGLSHNGNLTNAFELRRKLLEHGVGLTSTTDSELIAQILSLPPQASAAWYGFNESKHEDSWIARIQALMQVAEGAYTLAILTRDAIYATRDPHGLRPLCIGVLEDGSHVVASESCALSTVGATFVREVKAGEIIKLSTDGLTTVQGAVPKTPSLCSFEYVYFARPDSMLEGQLIHEARQRLGRQLAKESPVDADVVIPVPDSSVPAAIGYALESDIPFTEGLTKNRYIGRTFIQPDDGLRQMGVKLKFNPLVSNLKGKRVIMIDDSIVRGTTSGPLVKLLRDAGATEVHMRVSSPPVKHPCFMGVDMATYHELIAAKIDVEAIRQHIGADSLSFLSLDGMLTAIRGDEAYREATGRSSYCTACFSGQYPVSVPDWLFRDERSKNVFESSLAGES